MINNVFKRKYLGKSLGKYPACDHLNSTLDELLGNPETNRSAISEICYAIIKSDGYFYDNIKSMLKACGFDRFVD